MVTAEGTCLSRRRFILGCAALVGSSFPGLGGCAAAGAGAHGRPGPAPGRAAWIRVPIGSLTPGLPRRVEFETFIAGGSGRDAAWLVREVGGEVVAFVPLCTHAGCLYDLDAGAARFSCRCHQGYFGFDGRVLGGPPPRPLDRYPVRGAGVDAIEIGWLGGRPPASGTAPG